MAVDGLPIYYKNSKLVGPQTSKKRWKEYYLLVCTVVGFIILIAGVLWFVPSIEEDKSYSRAYNSFTGPSLMGVTDTSQEPEINPRPERPSALSKDNLLKRGGPEIDPRQRKLEEERQSPIVVVPGRGRPNNIEGRAVPEQEVKQRGDTQGVNGGDERESERDSVKQGGEKQGPVGTQTVESEEVNKATGQEEEGKQKEEEDPVTKQRREKIVEVCKISV